MKKCPFCHADIEDNARFCVFCMSSLQEKQKIKNEVSNNKWWPYLTAAFLLLALILGISILLLSNNQANKAATNGDDIQSSLPSTPFISNTNDNLPSDENTNNPIISPLESEDTNSQNSATEPENNPTTSNNSSQNNSTINSSDTATSTTSSQPQSTPQQSLDSSSDDTVTAPTSATFLYRNATASDCYTEGNIPAQPIKDVIVITGVASASSDGIYNIPEEIDGKRVGAIMPLAFCDSNISGTVKKVIVPASVKTIWQNAFLDCYNLSDIYLLGQTIDIFENSFSDFSKRNTTLTIHCSHNCKTFGLYFYRNIAQNYDAVYQEWNGGTIQ